MLKSVLKNRKSPSRPILLMGLCVFFFLSTSLSAAGFIFRNERIQPLQGSGSLSNSDLSSVAFQHQSDLETVKQELARTRQELRDAQKDLHEFKSEFSQFKNLYFRRF